MRTEPRMAASHGEGVCIFVILASTTNERSLRAGGLQALCMLDGKNLKVEDQGA